MSSDHILSTNPQKAKFASRSQVTEQDGSYILYLDLERECDVCVDAYEFSSDLRGVTLGKGHRLPAFRFQYSRQGRFVWDERARGPHSAVDIQHGLIVPSRVGRLRSEEIPIVLVAARPSHQVDAGPPPSNFPIGRGIARPLR